jgi:SNF2 family DNA or RNA helicase
MTNTLTTTDEEDPGALTGAFVGSLKPHQSDGLTWLLEHKRALLADDVGLGKTVQALALIGALLDAGDPSVQAPVLWLTDPALVDQTAGEVRRFLPAVTVLASTDPDFKDTQKADRSRAERFPGGIPQILMANYQQACAKRSLLTWEAFSSPGLVVLDEAMSLKGGGQTWKAVRRLLGNAGRVVAMTATPVENHAYETFLILELLGPAGLWPRRVFDNEFIEWDQYPGQAPRPVDLLPHKRREFSGFLQGVMLRRTEANAGLTLPTRVEEEYRKVPLSRTQHREYTHARRRRGMNLDTHLKSVALSHNGHSSLLDACVEEIEARPSEKVVVYCENLEPLDLLAERLEESGVSFRAIRGASDLEDRTTAVEDFRDDPDVRVLLGTRVIERGLNLQHARVLISLVQSYNPAREHQREGRIRRLGSPHRTYEHLVLEPDVPQAGRRNRILQEKTRRRGDLLGA